MSASNQRAKSQATAADLLRRGIYHGKRMTSPAKNSGGLTMSMAPGSAKFQRLATNRKPKH